MKKAGLNGYLFSVDYDPAAVADISAQNVWVCKANIFFNNDVFCL